MHIFLKKIMSLKDGQVIWRIPPREVKLLSPGRYCHASECKSLKKKNIQPCYPRSHVLSSLFFQLLGLRLTRSLNSFPNAFAA